MIDEEKMRLNGEVISQTERKEGWKEDEEDEDGQTGRRGQGHMADGCADMKKGVESGMLTGPAVRVMQPLCTVITHRVQPGKSWKFHNPCFCCTAANRKRVLSSGPILLPSALPDSIL